MAVVDMISQNMNGIVGLDPIFHCKPEETEEWRLNQIRRTEREREKIGKTLWQRMRKR
jgi:hypothetical protein